MVERSKKGGKNNMFSKDFVIFEHPLMQIHKQTSKMKESEEIIPFEGLQAEKSQNKH